jgi:hypothetical protein
MKYIFTVYYTNGVSNQKYRKKDLSIMLPRSTKRDSKKGKTDSS